MTVFPVVLQDSSIFKTASVLGGYEKLKAVGLD